MEDQYKKELAENGVDLDEVEVETPEPVVEEEVIQEEETKVEEESETEEDESESQEEDKSDKRKSIYKEYKETKKELREARTLLAELSEKVNTISSASTNQEKAEAEDELSKFATEIGADPEAIKKMRDIILKDSSKNSIDPEVLKRLNEVDAINKTLLREKHFNTEFNKVAPAVKEFFPGIAENELDGVKAKLLELSDKSEWQGKDLDYILFKNKDTLAKSVTPKKKGMESRNRSDATVEVSTEFNVDPDFSKMSSSEMESWEKQYKDAGRSDGLLTMGNKKLII